MATAWPAIRFGPKAMAMEKRRAIAKAHSDGGDIQPRLPRRAKGFAVIGGVEGSGASAGIT
jgi:hypothetical protein